MSPTRQLLFLVDEEGCLRRAGAVPRRIGYAVCRAGARGSAQPDRDEARGAVRTGRCRDAAAGGLRWRGASAVRANLVEAAAAIVKEVGWTANEDRMGVTDTEIKIGSWQIFSGPQAASKVQNDA